MPYSTPKKKKAHNQLYYKKWYAKNGRKRMENYSEIIEEWRLAHPKEVKAKRKVQSALLKGILVKPKKCVQCVRETSLSGHHEDYSKPLEVLWLCSSCHKLKHPP